VRVVQSRRDFDLLQETLGANRCRQIGLEDLERDLSVVLDVFREINGGHATGPDLADDRVAARQRGGESLNRVGQDHTEVRERTLASRSYGERAGLASNALVAGSGNSSRADKPKPASMQEMLDAIEAETGFDPSPIADARLRKHFP